MCVEGARIEDRETGGGGGESDAGNEPWRGETVTGPQKPSLSLVEVFHPRQGSSLVGTTPLCVGKDRLCTHGQPIALPTPPPRQL